MSRMCSESKMKSFRLKVHQKTFCDEDLLINPKDYPEAKEGDIVEIYHLVDDENPRLLLQVKGFKDDVNLMKDSISVEQTVAATFNLRKEKDICVTIVKPSEVALDSIELTFKDQYMGRSEMWRLKNNLIHSCVYMNKKLEFCNGAVRCQVYEMWSQGERVACGVITDDTKIVFRSSTSMVYLFLQMSSEMWDFDIYGDLYFEKAVNGFLSDLFMKWKKNGSNHEVTIVLFSRTFYEAQSLEEFPVQMRECLQKDYRGRYYEDFYRVAVQNEKYEDWCGVLVQLRRLFSQYLKIVLEYHQKHGVTIPKATNSTAAQGNFLEVLNMSLNVFEKHYLDRSFDRTGQLSVVITPGVGVFEVDRELTNITKQRIIDNGVGSDLVCVGEQPLHAVPLLKFHNKDTHLNVPDDYSMPHWINLSFYSTNRKLAYSNFIPRIKLPPCFMEENDGNRTRHINPNLGPQEDYIHNTFFDYDAYDAQIFQQPMPHTMHDDGHKGTGRYKRTSGGLLEPHELRGQRRKLSDPDIQYNHSPTTTRSQPISIPLAAVSPIVSPHNDDKATIPGTEWNISPPLRMVVGSEGSPPLESRALINPFDPSHVTIKLTSNRRRWTHIFPKGPSGVLIQQHHYQAVPSNNLSEAKNNQHAKSIFTAALHEYCKKDTSFPPSLSRRRRTPLPPKHPPKSTLLWGATGEQEWTPALTAVNEVLIGVDWKSLTIPACLPITTDYFPDKRALQIDYVVSLYNLLPDHVNADFAQQRVVYKNPLTTIEVFNELISQRLAQGFQLVLMPFSRDKASSMLRKRASDGDQTYILSIGRLFHKITLSGYEITVTRYRPRHPYPGFNYQYRYRFHAPHHDNYEESFASFTTEKLEHYNWNYVDHYICTRGDADFSLVDALKYWRFRIYLLPLNNAATKRIIDGAENCDIYTPLTAIEHQQMIEGFLKFTETVVNKIKRHNAVKKPRMSLSVINHNAPLVQPRRNSMSAVNQSSTSCNSPFRERVGSNRLPDRPRPRSGSKVMERGRASPAIETLQHMADNQSIDSNSEENISFDPLLKANATYLEIVESMKHPANGLTFVTITTHQSLPQHTFISADAVNWLMAHMEGISTMDQAIQIFVSMQREKFICHASGELTKPFYYGFYLYYIVLPGKQIEDNDGTAPRYDIISFENEWMEVEVKPALNWGLSHSSNALNIPTASNDREHGVPHFLCEEIDIACLQEDIDYPTCKHMYLDIDAASKSDRVEWGHIKYQRIFRPDQAYEITVGWLTASGSIVLELILGWARKAQGSCGLQIIPIPHDPLALPYSNKSDPLRGPIFIPLNLNCLSDHDILFRDFRGDSYDERLFLFQEAIVCRFGFIPCLLESTDNYPGYSQDHQYIHATGTVFILISSPLPTSRRQNVSKHTEQFGGRYSTHADVVPSPHEAYITRHVSGKNKDNYQNSKRMGFLWSWNHMISRRLKMNAVDGTFQIKLLRNFKEFCSNSDNRLKTFWRDCLELKADVNK